MCGTCRWSKLAGTPAKSRSLFLLIQDRHHMQLSWKQAEPLKLLELLWSCLRICAYVFPLFSAYCTNTDEKKIKAKRRLKYWCLSGGQALFAFTIIVVRVLWRDIFFNVSNLVSTMILNTVRPNRDFPTSSSVYTYVCSITSVTWYEFGEDKEKFAYFKVICSENGLCTHN